MNKILLDQLLADNSPTQRPFPGQYPTRVWISSTDAVKFEYLGKPVPSLLHLVRRRFILKGGRLQRLMFQEFDQNGIVASVRGGRFDYISTFYNTYLPFQCNLRENLFDYGVYYYLLNREVKVVEGKRIYWPRVFEGHAYEDYAKLMLSDCARGRVGKQWFGTATTGKILTDIGTVSLRWAKTQELKKKPPVPEPNTRPLFQRRPKPALEVDEAPPNWPMIPTVPEHAPMYIDEPLANFRQGAWAQGPLPRVADPKIEPVDPKVANYLNVLAAVQREFL